MSSFFGDLSGFTFPNSEFNQGPLPTGNILPNSAVHINYGNTLLGDVRPYKYGEPAHIEDQAAMLNTPHKIAKIIPELRLPDSRDGQFNLSHAVDDGDVAFVLRVNRNAGTIQQQNTFDRLELGRMVDPFVNLATVNYLLAGCQRYWNEVGAVFWQQFMVDTDFMPPLSQARRPFTVHDALLFVNEVARPFGIVHGSMMQGGQTEGSNEAVTYPVNFITTMAVSGRVENVANLWRDSNISAGNDLVFRLAFMPIASPVGDIEYNLNHWEKGVVRQRFDSVEGRNWAWQLVPELFVLDPPLETPEDYDWRDHGYWHIARCQVMKASEITSKLSEKMAIQKCYLDDARLLRGSVLEVNFEPVFVRHHKLPRPVHVDHVAPAWHVAVHHHQAAPPPNNMPPPLRLNEAMGGPPPDGGPPKPNKRPKKVQL